MSDLTISTVMNLAAYGLGLGTVFFSFFGIRADRDFFLMMGLVACTVGDTLFAFYLWEQGDEEAGRNNDTMATVFIMLGLLAVYAIYCQFESFRENGCSDEEDEEDDPVPAAAAAPMKLEPGEVARPMRPLKEGQKALADSQVRKR
jgi:hypothetical protein